ncbi:MAG: Crp/Fnr family transcriptional regulator [Chitinophagaceae bacterium]|nr:Crp/Fnr family transcriptional regulator [Chitinophagaceae bacterium]
MQELDQYIQSYFGLEEHEIATIQQLFKPETLKKHDYYLKMGRACERLSFIRSGYLRIFVTQADKEVTQWISTQGYFVTDLSALIFNTPARWHIQALSDTELFTISKSDYQSIGDLIPRWHQLEKLFIAKCFGMLEERVFSLLSMSAEDRYKLLLDTNPALLNEVPLQYLASMLGMSAETFSRIRRKMMEA